MFGEKHSVNGHLGYALIDEAESSEADKCCTRNQASMSRDHDISSNLNLYLCRCNTSTIPMEPKASIETTLEARIIARISLL